MILLRDTVATEDNGDSQSSVLLIVLSYKILKHSCVDFPNYCLEFNETDKNDGFCRSFYPQLVVLN